MRKEQACRRACIRLSPRSRPRRASASSPLPPPIEAHLGPRFEGKVDPRGVLRLCQATPTVAASRPLKAAGRSFIRFVPLNHTSHLSPESDWALGAPATTSLFSTIIIVVVVPPPPIVRVSVSLDCICASHVETSKRHFSAASIVRLKRRVSPFPYVSRRARDRIVCLASLVWLASGPG